VSDGAGKLEAAERWYRKAIDGGREAGDLLPTAKALGNLAVLLQPEAGRIREARQLAEDGMAIMRALDPSGAEIWKSYNILASISDKEAAEASHPARRTELLAEAREYRRLARRAEGSFAGTRFKLRPHAALILGTVIAAQQPEQRARIERTLESYRHESWKNLMDAIRRILAGERDEEALQAGQFGNSPMILELILRGIEDPSTLQDFSPAEEPPQA
jgi:tetratricopeptide repeat protein